MTDHIDCVVIGAGVVGLAVARSLARRGRDTIVLEAADAVGTGVSSRNSGVIHAGLYYPWGSLKARLCVAGRTLLYEFCEARGVAVNRCGKLVVASADAQLPTLSSIAAAARANGVEDLQALDKHQALRLEPQISCVAALWSPSTGIVDAHGLMTALKGDLENAGGMVIHKSPVQGGERTARGMRLRVGDDNTHPIEANLVVNCAGLAAQQLARGFDGVDGDTVPPLFYAKGNYFGLDGKVPFRRLIYPVPEEGGLGVHLTLDLSGRARFGPDVEWVERIDYGVDPARAESFYAAIRTYWPTLPSNALRADYSGIRPKTAGPGSAAQDFAIHGPEVHGVPGLVNLYGIESPGLTAALAIGEYVADASQ